MPFKALMQRVVEQTPGCINCTLLAFDGITVDGFDSDKNFSTVSIADSTVEYAIALNQMRKAGQGLEAGLINELCVRGEKLITVMRPLNEEYLVAAAFTPQALVGKGRYLLRLISPKLLEALSY